MRSLLFPLVSLVFIGVVLAVACGGPDAPTPCHEIPDGGCPLIDPTVDECLDVTCNALYSCVNAAWSLDKACPPHPVDGGAADAATDAALDAVAFDAGPLPPGSYGGPGCITLDPSAGDCWLGQAVVPGACCANATDPDCCLDIWTCTDGGLVPWGQCTSGAPLPRQ